MDDAQEEREDAAFRAKYNYGKGASKGDRSPSEPKKQMCLYYNDGGCKYGANCRYAHDDNAVLEGTREAGKSWDNASRRAIRDAGFHNVCYDFHIHGRCRKEASCCKYSHDALGFERLKRLRRLVQVANQVRFAQDRGLDLPDRNSFKPPTTEETETAGSQSLQLTNVSKEKEENDSPLDGAKKLEADVQKDSVAGSSTVQTLDPDEPIENWLARGKELWLYTPRIREAMFELAVSKVGELQQFVYVEDLVEKGVKLVHACKLLDAVGGVKYRPMSPEPAATTNATMRVEQSSGSQGAGNGTTRTIADVRKVEDPGGIEMPRGSYRDILFRGRYREAWSLEQRSPLCVQTLQLVGVGMPPVDPPKKGCRSWSNPVRRGRPLLNRKQVQKVACSYSNRRKKIKGAGAGAQATATKASWWFVLSLQHSMGGCEGRR